MPTTINIERLSFFMDKSDRKENEEKEKYSSEIDNSDIIETRLMVIGDRGVGKTALIKQLLMNAEDRSLSKKITTLGLKSRNGEFGNTYYTDHAISLCEFSDKDIYDGTFKIYFTRRSIYLLVYNTKGNDELDDLYYWLNTINFYSNGSYKVLDNKKIYKNRGKVDRSDFKGISKRIL